MQPASAKIETILSMAGVSTASLGVGLVEFAVAAGLEDLEGGQEGAEEEGGGRLREGICWWRNTILASLRRRFAGGAVISTSVREGDEKREMKAEQAPNFGESGGGVFKN